jgi:hypothetical protein
VIGQLFCGGGLERILCDTDANGTISAHYIHGPDLCYKITADGTLLCCHADAQAITFPSGALAAMAGA